MGTAAPAPLDKWGKCETSFFRDRRRSTGRENPRCAAGVGIALIAGMSKLFPFPKYLLLVCLAITPVPLIFLLRSLQQ